MNASPSPAPEPVCAPESFRAALAELVQMGLSVARMVACTADAETAVADAAARSATADEDRPMALSLAEAIEADRAFAAASDALQSLSARVDTITRAFGRASRSVRMTVLLAERVDRGWARGRTSDQPDAMTRRQVSRGVLDAIMLEADGVLEADGERAERLGEALSERLDVAEDIGDRPTDEIIQQVCRDLGLDPLRMTVVPPLREGAGFEAAVAAACRDMPSGWTVQTKPWVGGMRVPVDPRDGPSARASPEDG